MINDEAPCKTCGHAWHRHHTPHGGCNQVVDQERDGFVIECSCALFVPWMCGRCGHLQAEHANDDGLCDGECTTIVKDEGREACSCKGFIARPVPKPRDRTDEGLIEGCVLGLSACSPQTLLAQRDELLRACRSCLHGCGGAGGDDQCDACEVRGYLALMLRIVAKRSSKGGTSGEQEKKAGAVANRGAKRRRPGRSDSGG